MNAFEKVISGDFWFERSGVQKKQAKNLKNIVKSFI